LILLKTRHKDPAKTLGFKIDFMNDAFNKYPSILKNKDAMLKLKVSLDDKEQSKFFGYLCDEMQEPSMESDAYDFILVDTYASFGEMAFNDAVNQIKSSSPRRYKQYIKVICKLFWAEKDKDKLVRMFDTIHRVYDSAYIKNHIKREVNRKVWKTVKENEVLYQERKQRIDRLLSEVEETDKYKYSSLADVAADVENGTNPKSVAYFWLNMKSPAFEESVEASFAEMDPGCISIMRDVYRWLFDHSMRKGGPQELNRMCEKVAISLYRFAEAGRQSEFYDDMDECWLENVITYKLKGTGIEKYMFAVHYEKVKEWKE